MLLSLASCPPSPSPRMDFRNDRVRDWKKARAEKEIADNLAAYDPNKDPNIEGEYHGGSCN